jgi:hypothetical protein
MRAGDTLYSVARRHGVTPMDLVMVNPDVSSHNVRVGTLVRIPYVGMSAKAVSATMPPVAMPDSTAPYDEMPEETAPDTLMPEETAPYDEMLEETAPDTSMPEEAAPYDEMLEETAPDTSMPEEAAPTLALRDEMRTLWEQRVWWTRELILSIIEGLPDEAEVTSRLLENPDRIAALFRPAFGDQAAETLARLLSEHLIIGAEIMKAAKENDAEAVDDANQRWNANADAIAAALASLGPQFPEAETREMLRRHLDLTREELAGRLAGDYQRDIDAFDAIEQQALMTADFFSQGIAQAGR